MTRQRGRAINGWLIIDKPHGMTSTAVVNEIRRASRAAKAGHAGTLDPIATGVLPIAFGEATKTMSYVVDGLKTYRFSVCWGERRDTDDCEGDVVETSDTRPSEAAIRRVLPAFSGEIDQVPPTYSAIKVAGRRAYELARADMAVDLAPRRVMVHRIELVDVPDMDHAVFEVQSGKGVYMRALARDIAMALGTAGYIVTLRRLAVGPFDEAVAVPLATAKAMAEEGGNLAPHLLSVGAALAGIPALALTDVEARRLQHGQAIAALPVASRSAVPGLAAESLVCATAKGKPVALARIRGGEIRPLRILNL